MARLAGCTVGSLLGLTMVLALTVGLGTNLTFAQGCAYEGNVFADSPIAYWRLGEATGLTASNIGSLVGVDGTYTNGVNQGVPGLIPGDPDLAAGFDGSDDFVSIPDNAGINTGGPYAARTIELWFQANDVAARQVLYEEGGDIRGLNVYIEDNNLYLNGWNTPATDGAGSPWEPSFITATVSAGTTYHVVLVFEGDAGFAGTITGYLDGTSMGTATGIGLLYAHADDIGIGRENGLSNYHDGLSGTTDAFQFNGVIDEVALYDHVLSLPRIQLHARGCGSPDLALSKDDSGGSTTPGDAITYTLSYTNNGTLDATGVIISDTVPANTAFDAVSSTAGWQQVSATNVYTFDVGSLSVSANGTVVFAVIVDNPIPAGVTEITNTASIADDGANGPEQNPNDNQGSDITPVSAAPDLALTKTDGGISTVPGSTVVYALNYANNGNQGATGLVISDTVPANTTFNAAASPGWICADGSPAGTPCVFDAGSLSGGGGSGTANFAVTVVDPFPPGVQQIDNTASIADDGANGPDQNPGDNQASDSTPVGAGPDLAVTVTDGGITTTPGGVVAYTLNYANNGSQDATDVVITDTLPANTSFNAGASTAGWQQIGTTNEYALDVGGLGPGALGATASGSVTFAVTLDNPLPAGVTQITNVATISDDGSNGPDLNSNDNAGSDTTPIQYPSPAPPPSNDDDDDDDDNSGPPPTPPPSQPASAPAPTPAVIHLPETGVGSPGVDPSVWPFAAVPGLALLLGWAIYRRRDK